MPAAPLPPPPASPTGPADRGVLWLAQGFGSGWSPLAPGTAGSFVGVAWFLLLLWSGNVVVLTAGTLLLGAVSIPVCARAERLLGKKDPGSVVLDEIIAVPVGLAANWLVPLVQTGRLPGVGQVLAWPEWAWLLAGFAVFRVLDALKPPPVGMCQRLPGGWGIVADDVVAAVLTGLAVSLVRWQLPGR